MKEGSYSFETQSQHCMIKCYQPQLHQILQNTIWAKSLRSNKLIVIAFASRALIATEQRYAPFKKASLGVTWACEKFRRN